MSQELSNDFADAKTWTTFCLCGFSVCLSPADDGLSSPRCCSYNPRAQLGGGADSASQKKVTLVQVTSEIGH